MKLVHLQICTANYTSKMMGLATHSWCLFKKRLYNISPKPFLIQVDGHQILDVYLHWPRTVKIN